MTKTAPTTTAPKGRVLIIDDEPGMCEILVKSLKRDGFDAIAYCDARLGLEAIASDQPDLVLTDVRMPQMDGREVLDRVLSQYPEIPVLIMTAFGTIEDAVTMLKAGAFNYITKPFQHEDLLHQIQLALQRRQLEQENVKLSEQGIPQEAARVIIGSSAGLERVRRLIRGASDTASPVLITGESGVGKELVAREIHRQSKRRPGRFVAVNCPAIPATLIESELFGYERGAFTGADEPKMGLIELSAGGTLFLDEIAELPVELQAKLLRVIQERENQRLGGLRQIPVDLRVIAATNRNLKTEIEAGRFRVDLYYRINVIPIEVPPLRERPEDIPELIEHFVERIARSSNRPGFKLSGPVIEFFKDCTWPGNIRELENTLERIAVLSDESVIDRTEFAASVIGDQLTIASSAAQKSEPDDGASKAWPLEYKTAREEFETAYLKQLLTDCEGNVALAARRSGISRRSLYEKFERYGIEKDALG